MINKNLKEGVSEEESETVLEMDWNGVRARNISLSVWLKLKFKSYRMFITVCILRKHNSNIY